ARDRMGQRRRRVEAGGILTGPGPLRVGRVGACGYKGGANWRPRLLSQGQGALEMLANAVPARSNPKASLATIERVVSQAPVLKGPRGEAALAAASILKRLETVAQDGILCGARLRHSRSFSPAESS